MKQKKWKHIISNEDFEIDSFGRVIVKESKFLHEISGARSEYIFPDGACHDNAGCSNSGC